MYKLITMHKLSQQVSGEIYLEEINAVLDDYYIEDNKLYNKVTGSNPSHLRFNGVLFKNLISTGVLNDVMPWKEGANANSQI